MTHTNIPPSYPTSDLPRRGRKALWIFCLGLVWIQFVYQLHFEWLANPQYQYGFCVPPLVLYFWSIRWPGIVASHPEPHRDHQSNASLVFAILCLASLLPIRLLQESNPEWRLSAWIHAFAVIGLTLGMISSSYGIRSALRLAPPLLFLLTSIPWPTFLEAPLTSSLMRLSAEITVEFLNWRGIPAWRHGNLIELTSGLVGVNEACSGIRSLQSGVMMSAFWAEWRQLPTLRRITFLLLAPVLTVLLNLIRTATLSTIAATQGPKAIESFHDPAGWTVASVNLIALWGIAKLLQPRLTSAPPIRFRSSIPVTLPGALWRFCLCCPSSSNSPLISGSNPRSSRKLLKRFGWPQPASHQPTPPFPCGSSISPQKFAPSFAAIPSLVCPGKKIMARKEDSSSSNGIPEESPPWLRRSTVPSFA
ncbi:MAG: exosortase/archaeosortase family protein [Verrucomicrobia bacterium]|nr:exosortase/archaeosortase family protein [Verrucomicrobiota bacterium]